MDLNRTQLDELTSVIEDTVEYACDKEQISGTAAWTAVNCLSRCKLMELSGQLSGT